MEATTIEKKRKNIDLPADILHKLDIMAAAQGKSLKSFIESALVTMAQSFEFKVRQNPSPSGDPFFENSENLAEIEKRVKEHKEGKSKATVTLRTAEEIKNFMDNL